jgi:hypothetical protein
MKCPSCGAASADGAAECPACGLIFAKWREKSLKALELPPPSPPAPDRWIGRAIAAVIVILWLGGFGYYVYRHTLKRTTAAQPSVR